MAELAQYAAANGMKIIDTYQRFIDYVLSGGDLQDLLDPSGEDIHPKGPGVTRQGGAAFDEIGVI